jgi:hypothetical protein
LYSSAEVKQAAEPNTTVHANVAVFRGAVANGVEMAVGFRLAGTLVIIDARTI